jgi:ATP-dependent helicase HrpB
LKRSELPVDALLPALVEAVRAHPLTLLEAEPGAGKTTRVPPALIQAGFSQVIVLEPRRMAARIAARRVAQEMSEAVGETVGYQVRFEQQGSARTRLWFVTEGVLTRRLRDDPDLAGVDAVVLDEFHERHLDTDIALALLRRLQRRRDLRLVIMSATLDTEELSRRLGFVPMLKSEGRQFPVAVRYTPHSSMPVSEQVAAAVTQTIKDVDGHILVFLSGASEIRRAMEASSGVVRSTGAVAMALHGDLPAEEQDRVVAPSTQRKVIFSTNVAESSVTIDGVRAVVDSGLARVATWSPWSGLAHLRVERISRASAIQRAGRAGRTAPGVAVRLYTEEDFNRRPDHIAPEILRADLNPVLLQLADMDVAGDDVPWLDAPPEQAIAHARELLLRLGALSGDGCITPLGRQMSSIPLHPRLSRFFIEATRQGVGREASRIAAALSEGRLRMEERERRRHASDLDVILEMDHGGTVRRLEQQVAKALPRGERERLVSQSSSGSHAVEMAVLRGFPDRVGRRRGDTVLLSNGGSATLDRASALESEFLCAVELEQRSEQASAVIRVAAPIEPDWLLEFFPDHIETRDEVIWNRAAERVEQRSALLYDALVIDESIHATSDLDAATELVVQKALEAGIERFIDRTTFEELLSRARFAGHYDPSVQVDAAVIEKALHLAAQGVRGFSELRQALANGAFKHVLESLLPMTLMDEVAPPSVKLTGGRRARIQYADGQDPWVASRLQDFFGMRETPRVARGAVPVVVHLLAPNHRPVQMTKDLASFWRNLYPQVRRELSRRYPKHKWPEDPLLG